MQRKIDQLGRLVLPYDYRNRMGLRRGDPIDMHVVGDSVVIRTVQRRCVFCENERVDRLHRMGGVDFCEDCAEKIRGGLL